jgi:Rhs element Vgr protein
MPTSPLLAAADVLAIEISVGGKKINDSYLLNAVEVYRAVNKVATAKVVFFLPVGNGDNVTFAMSEADDFTPGNTIEIKVGDAESAKSVVFKGIIVNQSIRCLGGATNELILSCSDKAVKMTLGRQSAYFQDMKDSAIIAKIVGDYGLSAKTDTTTVEHKQIVQYQTNDWDFIISRAEANGLLTYTQEDDVLVKKPLASGNPDLELDFGRDVIAFDMGLEARHQTPSVSCKAWDMKTQKMLEGKSSDPALPEQGNLSGKDLASKVGLKSTTLSNTAPLNQNELKAWADAELLRSRMSALRGEITFLGNALPKLNTLISLKGFGDRFNKMGLITGIHHSIRAGLWQTTVHLGLPPEWLYEQRLVSAPPAAGLIPTISGLQNGKVKKIDSDPDGELRIQVDIPAITPAGAGVWARMAHFYATAGKGSFFLPEPGDEVVLGFLNDDPRFPVILGMLYSSKNKAPYTPDDKNTIKAIVTKNDLKMEFNDVDKVLTLKTPGGNEFILSDKDKSITVKDQNGNKIEMSNAGIRLDSAKDVSIKAKGKISLEAVSGITAKASGGDVTLEGLNVNAKAQISFSAQGSASAELKASGQTSVKGAMVMIN